MKSFKSVLFTTASLALVSLVLLSTSFQAEATTYSAVFSSSSDEHDHSKHPLGQHEYNQPFHSQAAPISRSASQPEVTTNAAPVDVDIMDFAFAPDVITLTVGTTVRWTNKDSATHTATSTTGVFDSGNLIQGQTFEFTFNQAGTFNYLCSRHLSMRGKAVVLAAPTLTAISPDKTNVGGDDFTMTITGTNFITNVTTIDVAGVNRPATVLNSTKLTTLISASDVSTFGDKAVIVVNPPNLMSTPLTLTVNTVQDCDARLVSKVSGGDGICGTLPNALKTALGGGSGPINFVPLTVPISIPINVNPDLLNLAANVTLNGLCENGQPTITIDGTGLTGFVLKGGSNLYGLKLIGFSGPQVKAAVSSTGGPGVGGNNRLNCMVLSRT